MPDEPFKVNDAVEHVRQQVGAWPGVWGEAHHYGARAFRVAEGEVGRVLRCGLVDLPLPPSERARWLSAGRVRPHHAELNSDWVTVNLDGEADVAFALELLWSVYTRLTRANLPPDRVGVRAASVWGGPAGQDVSP